MKCMNCATEIPPNWVACIQKNICPACGEAILDSSGEELLKELTEAMERMPNDPAGVAGWLLSNFFIKKIGDAEPVDNFYGRKKAKKASEQDLDDESYDRFKTIWKNSRVKPQDKSSLKSKIESDVEEVLKNQYGDEDELDVSSDEEYEEDDGSEPFSELDKDLFSLSENDQRLAKLMKQDKSTPSFSGAFSRK